MTRQFDVVVERDSEGYFVASVPALSGCHTQAKSLDALRSAGCAVLVFARNSALVAVLLVLHVPYVIQSPFEGAY